MKKRLIRQRVFETNSSSCHSISLGKDTGKQFLLDTIYPDSNGNITLTGGEFGWDWFKTNEATEKANYAAVESMNNDNFRQTLIDVIRGVTGCEEVVFDLSTDYNSDNYSYIDHDSVGTCPDDYEGLKDFIFNQNSWLFGGNDNGTASPTFYHVPEYKDGQVIEPTYKWELVIYGLNLSTKFLSYPSDEELGEALDALLGGVYLNEDGEQIQENGGYGYNSGEFNVYEYSSYLLPPDLENKIIWFKTGNYPETPAGATRQERQQIAIEHFINTAISVNFEINDIQER